MIRFGSERTFVAGGETNQEKAWIEHPKHDKSLTTRQAADVANGGPRWLAKIGGRLEGAMGNTEALREFKEGLDNLHNRFPRQGLVHLKRAVELDKDNPFYRSYLGLAVAKVEGNTAEAENLCYDAMKKQRNQPELYLNLAEVYRLADKKEDAIDCLTTGLKLTRQDARLAEALEKMGRRRPPVLSFLDRRNFLNVQLGKIRYKVAGR
jgi:tetratricopeptide (TPR) repeat protein